VQPVGASLQAIQQMVAGNADFAEVNASAVVQSNPKNNLPVRVVMDNGVIDWAVAVNVDGPIKSITDLKGKTIGVFSLATGGVAYLNTYLRANGLDPGKDVDLVPLGLGAPPVEALRSGKVQGLLYWAAAISTFENAGLKLRKLTSRSSPAIICSAASATCRNIATRRREVKLSELGPVRDQASRRTATGDASVLGHASRRTRERVLLSMRVL
jgi:ABC-type nitrate/sulfonate/bicarbonate transport system substrate-binding protein